MTELEVRKYHRKYVVTLPELYAMSEDDMNLIANGELRPRSRNLSRYGEKWRLERDIRLAEASKPPYSNIPQ